MESVCLVVLVGRSNIAGVVVQHIAVKHVAELEGIDYSEDMISGENTWALIERSFSRQYINCASIFVLPWLDQQQVRPTGFGL
jgi:hypothetical protein